MTIIIFLIDTSGSMNQKTYLGTSILDISKCAVEYFMKVRSRDPNSRLDRYMLMTYEEPPGNIKAGWKESHATFISELKNLKASGMTTLGPSLKYTFDLLNVNRMQSGIDTYGQGRCPFYLEPAVIISLTDGCHFSTMAGIQKDLQLPMDAAMVPGSELTKEPFRWDQRLFSLVLRIPAVQLDENQQVHMPSPLESMSAVTGGQAYTIVSQKGLHQCLESLVQRCQSGVVINFEKIGPDPPPIPAAPTPVDGDVPMCAPLAPPEPPSSELAHPAPWHNTRKLIYVVRTGAKGLAQGHWPLPEAFWPDSTYQALPARSAHPIVSFSCAGVELANIVEQLPFDKYELEPSPLTHYILERRQPNVLWQVSVKNSGKNMEQAQPFGYLKASGNLSTVNLVVLPYDYPTLLRLLDELINVHKGRATMSLRSAWEQYLADTPAYYVSPLRRALARMSLHGLLPDVGAADNCLSYGVISYLKRLKNQAKVEFEKIVASVGQRASRNTLTRLVPVVDRSACLEVALAGVDAKEAAGVDYLDAGNFALNCSADRGTTAADDYTNPFDVPRCRLLAHWHRMRAQVGATAPPEAGRHCIAVGQMGNYQEFVRRQPPPLRSIGNQPARINTFGNPFKVNKNLLSVDEADEAVNSPDAQFKAKPRNKPPDAGPVKAANGSGSDGPVNKKRKAGPMSKEVSYRTLLSPIPDRAVVSPVPFAFFPHSRNVSPSSASSSSVFSQPTTFASLELADFSVSPSHSSTSNSGAETDTDEPMQQTSRFSALSEVDSGCASSESFREDSPSLDNAFRKCEADNGDTDDREMCEYETTQSICIPEKEYEDGELEFGESLDETTSEEDVSEFIESTFAEDADSRSAEDSDECDREIESFLPKTVVETTVERMIRRLYNLRNNVPTDENITYVRAKSPLYESTDDDDDDECESEYDCSDSAQNDDELSDSTENASSEDMQQVITIESSDELASGEDEEYDDELFKDIIEGPLVVLPYDPLVEAIPIDDNSEDYSDETEEDNEFNINLKFRLNREKDIGYKIKQTFEDEDKEMPVLQENTKVIEDVEQNIDDEFDDKLDIYEEDDKREFDVDYEECEDKISNDDLDNEEKIDDEDDIEFNEVSTEDEIKFDSSDSSELSSDQDIVTSDSSENGEQKDELKVRRLKIEEYAFQRIKRPMNSVAEIVAILKGYDGDEDERNIFINRMISEAFRFKRITLANELRSIINQPEFHLNPIDIELT